jgi:hypothetical protein
MFWSNYVGGLSALPDPNRRTSTHARSPNITKNTLVHGGSQSSFFVSC